MGYKAKAHPHNCIHLISTYDSHKTVAVPPSASAETNGAALSPMGGLVFPNALVGNDASDVGVPVDCE
jgi:hypothetical protein